MDAGRLQHHDFNYFYIVYYIGICGGISMNVGLIIKKQEDNVYYQCISMNICIFGDLFNEDISDIDISVYNEVFEENPLHEE
jgi:hypothetical protein